MTRHYKQRLNHPNDRFPPACLPTIQRMWEGYDGGPAIVACLAALGVEATPRQVRDLAKRRGWQRPVDFSTRFIRHKPRPEAAPARHIVARAEWEGWVWPRRQTEPERPPRKGQYFPNSGFSMLGGRVR